MKNVPQCILEITKMSSPEMDKNEITVTLNFDF